MSAFQKVATFEINGRQKHGGNVASYFCTPDGRVLHAIAGPVYQATFLRESRWANETYQHALLDNQTTLEQLQTFFRKAHLERLQSEQNVRLPADRLPPATGTVTVQSLARLLNQNAWLHLNNAGQVHLLLAVAPLPGIDRVYGVVFEQILNEQVSTRPVAVR